MRCRCSGDLHQDCVFVSLPNGWCVNLEQRAGDSGSDAWLPSESLI